MQLLRPWLSLRLSMQVTTQLREIYLPSGVFFSFWQLFVFFWAWYWNEWGYKRVCYVFVFFLNKFLMKTSIIYLCGLSCSRDFSRLQSHVVGKMCRCFAFVRANQWCYCCCCHLFDQGGLSRWTLHLQPWDPVFNSSSLPLDGFALGGPVDQSSRSCYTTNW